MSSRNGGVRIKRMVDRNGNLNKVKQRQKLSWWRLEEEYCMNRGSKAVNGVGKGTDKIWRDASR